LEEDVCKCSEEGREIAVTSGGVVICCNCGKIIKY